MAENVTTRDPFICSGCGVCAAICPQNALQMTESVEGGYRPMCNDECINCGICLEICPFVHKLSLTRDEYRSDFPRAHEYHPILGRHCGAILGGVTDATRRNEVASGGYLTWILEVLLDSDMIDAVYCPLPTGEADPLYQYARCSSIESIRSAAGSAYYPIPLTQVVQEIRQRPGRYAITALPCQARALRAAMMKIPALRERIVFLMGLVCGQLKTKHFAELLMTEAGAPYDQVRYIQFRIKRADKPSKIHESRVFWHSVDREQSAIVPMGKWFMLRSLSLWACNYCMEVFPQAADIVFMDAWLDPYRHQPEGTSIALFRDPQLMAYFHLGAERGELTVAPASEQDVLLSQRSGIIQKYRYNPARVGIALPDGLAGNDVLLPNLPFLVRWFLHEDARRDQLAIGLWRTCGNLEVYLARLRKLHRQRWIPLVLTRLFVREW